MRHKATLSDTHQKTIDSPELYSLLTGHLSKTQCEITETMQSKASTMSSNEIKETVHGAFARVKRALWETLLDKHN